MATPTNLSFPTVAYSSIILNWTPGTGSTNTLIVRKQGSIPTSRTDGTTIYEDNGNAFIDTGLNTNTQYCYALYSVDDSRSPIEYNEVPVTGCAIALANAPIMTGAVNGSYTINQFTLPVGATTSSLIWKVPDGVTQVEYLVVGGGGGGASGADYGYGGGGGGGVIKGGTSVSGSVSIVVGAGGLADTDGSNSSFSSFIGLGGKKGSGTTGGASGNNVLSPEGNKDLFNVADYYFVDDSYFSILNIPMVSGQSFKKDISAPNEVMISKKGADLLVMNNGWTDGVVGKSVEITEHNRNGASNISGIFNDFIMESISSKDERPSVFFYMPRERFIEIFEKNPAFNFLILIKTRPGNNYNVMQKFTDIFNSAVSRGEAQVYSLAAEQENRYQAQKGFRNALYVGGFVILLVTVMGLLGYLNDEIARYRKNLAIRRINGATAADVILIFVSDNESSNSMCGIGTDWCMVSGSNVDEKLHGKDRTILVDFCVGRSFNSFANHCCFCAKFAERSNAKSGKIATIRVISMNNVQ
ncbi:MAG: hypothetical protein BWZ00_01000 [Bacteroidetes bacterium ADurb.BinA174]|nr:MAG: hypothetical protein BWZ00_01000 [Bacteroidetes bacterium ADurb.BinA174]